MKLDLDEVKKGICEDVKKIQQPKKVVKNAYGVCFCPYCNGSVWQNKDESKYCFRCGEKLNW